MARQKTVIRKNITQSDAEDAFETYSYYADELLQIENKITAGITAMRMQFEDQVKCLQEERNKAFDVLYDYAKQHPELFKKNKSVKWNKGSFGYRTGMPRLQTQTGFTWTDSLNLIKQLNPVYIRTVEEINKDLIIADRAKLKTDMDKIGVEVIQDETFFVQLR